RLLSFLLLMVSGRVHRHQLIVIEILQAENRLLQQRLRGRRIRFTDAEGAFLARKAKGGGSKGSARTRNHRLSRYPSAPRRRTAGICIELPAENEFADGRAHRSRGAHSLASSAARTRASYAIHADCGRVWLHC